MNKIHWPGEEDITKYTSILMKSSFKLSYNLQKMSLIERVRFFHHEYLDIKQRVGPKLLPTLRRQCLHEVGIIVDDAVKSDGIRKYELWLSLPSEMGLFGNYKTRSLQCGKTRR
mgnify:CR=1 FL=1